MQYGPQVDVALTGFGTAAGLGVGGGAGFGADAGAGGRAGFAGAGTAAGGAGAAALVVTDTVKPLPSPVDDSGTTLKLYLVPDRRPFTLISRISEATVVITIRTPVAAQTYAGCKRMNDTPVRAPAVECLTLCSKLHLALDCLHCAP